MRGALCELSREKDEEEQGMATAYINRRRGTAAPVQEARLMLMKETQYTFGLHDICAIRITCKCGASMSLVPGHYLPDPLVCVNCRTRLADDLAIRAVVSDFVYALMKALLLKGDKFDLHLVVDPKVE